MYLINKTTFVFQLSLIHKKGEIFILPDPIKEYLSYRKVLFDYCQDSGSIEINCKAIDLSFFVEVINGTEDIS